MSIMRALESEEIHLKNKEYKRALKARLRELMKDGSEAEQMEAKREYDRLFPKFEFRAKEKQEKQYESRRVGRRAETIPYICCKTCGKISDRVQEFEDPDLISEKRKTWRRVIKPNLSYYLYLYNRKLRNRRLFFAYNMMPCIQKKHKLQLKFKAKKTIVEMQYDYMRSRA